MEKNYEDPRPKDENELRKSDDPQPNTSGDGGDGVIKPGNPKEKNPNKQQDNFKISFNKRGFFIFKTRY